MSSGESEDNSYDNYVGEIFKSNTNNYYAVLYELGHGAYSSVWLGCHLQQNMYYAIKVLKEEEHDTGMCEINTYNVLKASCKHLCYIKEHFYIENNNNKLLIIIFELLGCTTYDLLKIKKYKYGLPLNVVRQIMKQITETLNEMHKNNMIHTDIKPENIFIECQNKKINDIITTFNKFNIKQKYNNIKSQNKLTIKWNNIDITALKKILNDILTNMQLIKKDNNNDDNDDSSLLAFSDITTFKSESDIEIVSCDSDNDNINNIILNENNINIRVGDLGTVLHNATSYDIQTRYYRAPEILLKYNCSTKIDIWSLGCLFYELLTSNILFNPDKTSINNRDRHHLLLFISMLGPIPDYLINKSELKYIYFKKNNLLKSNTEIIFIPLCNTICNKYTNDEKNIIINFLYTTLEYDYSKRVSCDKLLQHIFLHTN